MKLRVLLTGAHGQVGSAIRTLVDRDKREHHRIQLFPYAKTELDITDRDEVNNTITELQPDVVINAAAYTAVDKAEEDLELAKKINVDAVENLALACEASSIPLLHISTDYVFDGQLPIGSCYKETDQTNPLGIYGKTKLAGENKLQEICQKHIIFRTSWVFGVDGNNFVKTMLKLFKQKDSLSIVSDQYGGPTSADAIAKALLMIAKNITEEKNNFEQWGVYHFAGQPVISWCEFAEKINVLYNSEDKLIKAILPIPAEQFGAKAQRPTNSALDASKIKQVFNIDPCDWQQDLLTVIELS